MASVSSQSPLQGGSLWSDPTFKKKVESNWLMFVFGYAFKVKDCSGATVYVNKWCFSKVLEERSLVDEKIVALVTPSLQDNSSSELNSLVSSGTPEIDQTPKITVQKIYESLNLFLQENPLMNPQGLVWNVKDLTNSCTVDVVVESLAKRVQNIEACTKGGRASQLCNDGRSEEGGSISSGALSIQPTNTVFESHNLSQGYLESLAFLDALSSEEVKATKNEVGRKIQSHTITKTSPGGRFSTKENDLLKKHYDRYDCYLISNFPALITVAKKIVACQMKGLSQEDQRKIKAFSEVKKAQIKALLERGYARAYNKKQGFFGRKLPISSGKDFTKEEWACITSIVGTSRGKGKNPVFSDTELDGLWDTIVLNLTGQPNTSKVIRKVESISTMTLQVEGNLSVSSSSKLKKTKDPKRRVAFAEDASNTTKGTIGSQDESIQ